MILSDARRGDKFRISTITDSDLKAQLMRFGLAEGTMAMCYEVIPAGPIIVKKNHQEIAIGRHLADGILIEILRVGGF